MNNTGTDTEKQFADKMTVDGWDVYHNGFPDFLCIKDGEACFVEVKGKQGECLKAHQALTLSLLSKYGNLPVFVWNPSLSDLKPFQDYPVTKGKNGQHTVKEAENHNTKTKRDKKLVAYKNKHPELSLAEIGVKFNLTKQRVSQILKKQNNHKG